MMNFTFNKTLSDSSLSVDPTTCQELLQSQVGVIENLNHTMLLKMQLVSVIAFISFLVILYFYERKLQRPLKKFEELILSNLVNGMFVLLAFLVAYLFAFIN